MFFQNLLERCRESVRRRIWNGQVTERSLSIRAGVSQPHLHNVLKGARPLSPELADRLIRELGIPTAELMNPPAGPPGGQSGRIASP